MGPDPERVCPRCGEDLNLVDPTEEVWLLDPEDYTEGAEVWLCTSCDWNEEADEEEAIELHLRYAEWVAARLERLQEAKHGPKGAA